MAAGLVVLNKASSTLATTVVGQGSSSQMVTLFNNSLNPITVAPVVVGGDFMLSGNSCTGIVAGGGTHAISGARRA